jgi:hypothetical protein
MATTLRRKGTRRTGGYSMSINIYCDNKEAHRFGQELDSKDNVYCQECYDELLEENKKLKEKINDLKDEIESLNQG